MSDSARAVALPAPVAMPHPVYQLALDALPVSEDHYQSAERISDENEFFRACYADAPHGFGTGFEDRNEKATTVEMIQAAVAEWLASFFAAGLLRELGADALRTVVAANAADGRADVCHSHDHCDANMVMLEAFRELGVPSPLDHADGSPDNVAASRLWNAAWAAAAARHFAPLVA